MEHEVQATVNHRQERLEQRMDSIEAALAEIAASLRRSSSSLRRSSASSSPSKQGTCIASPPASPSHAAESMLLESSIDNAFSGSSSSPDSEHQQRNRHQHIPPHVGERDAAATWRWIECVERYFSSGHVSDEEEKVVIAAYHLKDAAYHWWKGLKASGSTVVTWENFKLAFLKAFLPANHVREAKFALMDLRQLKSVAEYNRHFAKLMSRVPSLTEDDKLAYYIHGLKSNVRAGVDDHSPRSLDEAMRTAELCEALKYSW